ncbi:MAG: glycosyltransferase family 4 protein [Anaerolineae bacterium]
MRRKLVIIESASEMGGVEFSTLYLVTHLDKACWQVTVVCPGEGQLVSACREAGIPVKVVSLTPLLSTSFRLGHRDSRVPNPVAWVWNGCATLVAAGRLKRFLSRDQPDLLLTKGLYAHLCGGLAAKRAGIRCVWHLQDFISERFWGIPRSFWGFLARVLPDEIVADGTPIARQLPAAVQKYVRVLLNGVDTQEFRPDIDGMLVRQQLGIAKEQVVIGHAARITPWKGQHHLLEAFASLAVHYPQLRLLLVGAPVFDNDRYEQSLRARVCDLHLQDRVIFAGFRRDLPQVLAAMDIFAYPSVEKDTSPLALLSAMSCGLPVAAFDIEGVREVVGNAGLLVPVRDEAGLADSLARLIVDQLLRQELALRSRESAVTRFSLEQYVAGMESALLRRGA